jgi:hypothetical protein
MSHDENAYVAIEEYCFQFLIMHRCRFDPFVLFIHAADSMVGLGKMDNSTLQSLTIATNAMFVMVTKCQVRPKKLKFS